jgi:hypothetical protein
MTRAELERLDRDALISRAEAAGVTRARILTRPELVDELLLRSYVDPVAQQRARGLFGAARDLLARVVEKGLHLPDAAERIRSLGVFALPAIPRAPAALPTVTLAEIYAAQGHRDRAVETLEGVLAREPDHVAARTLLSQLGDSSYPLPPPRLPPEELEEPDAAPAQPARGSAEEVVRRAEPEVDECVAIPVDARTLSVYWAAREPTLAYLRSAHPGGCVSLRVFIVEPTWDGPHRRIRDRDVGASMGDFVVTDLPPTCIIRVAVGWRRGGAFVPIAHSPALETLSGSTSPALGDGLVRWTPRGAVPVSASDRDAPSIERALRRTRREVYTTSNGYPPST